MSTISKIIIAALLLASTLRADAQYFGDGIFNPVGSGSKPPPLGCVSGGPRNGGWLNFASPCNTIFQTNMTVGPW